MSLARASSQKRTRTSERIRNYSIYNVIHIRDVQTLPTEKKKLASRPKLKKLADSGYGFQHHSSSNQRRLKQKQL
jgi:hypothetical protein